AGGVFAKARCEQRRATQLTDDQVFGALGIREQQFVDRPILETFGQAQGDAVVGPDRVQIHTQARAYLRTDGQRPRSVDSSAERREHTDAPVAELVTEALDDDGPIA